MKAAQGGAHVVVYAPLLISCIRAFPVEMDDLKESTAVVETDFVMLILRGRNS